MKTGVLEVHETAEELIAQARRRREEAQFVSLGIARQTIMLDACRLEAKASQSATKPDLKRQST